MGKNVNNFVFYTKEINGYFMDYLISDTGTKYNFLGLNFLTDLATVGGKIIRAF